MLFPASNPPPSAPKNLPCNSSKRKKSLASPAAPSVRVAKAISAAASPPRLSASKKRRSASGALSSGLRAKNTLLDGDYLYRVAGQRHLTVLPTESGVPCHGARNAGFIRQNRHNEPPLNNTKGVAVK